MILKINFLSLNPSYPLSPFQKGDKGRLSDRVFINNNNRVINIDNSKKGVCMNEYDIRRNNYMERSFNERDYENRFNSGIYDGNFDTLADDSGVSTKSSLDDGRSHIIANDNEDKEIVDADAKAETIYNEDEGVQAMRKRWLNYTHNECIAGVSPYDTFKTKNNIKNLKLVEIFIVDTKGNVEITITYKAIFNKTATSFNNENRKAKIIMQYLSVCNSQAHLDGIVRLIKKEDFQLRSNLDMLRKEYTRVNSNIQFNKVKSRKNWNIYNKEEIENVRGSF